MRTYLSILIILVFFFPINVFAGAGDNVYGWAWSENIGWISFNCTNEDSCVTVDYGVNIESSGNMTGYAWSEYTDYIDFNPASGYPEAPNYSAQVDLDTGEVSGWARAMAYDGGWDGWIKMRGTTTDGGSYGVSINTTTGVFKDYAWGDTVVGWISFNDEDFDGSPGPVDYQVITTSGIFNQAPYIEGGSQIIEGQDYCILGQGRGQVSFKWTYKDDDGDTQSQFDFRVNNVNNVNDANPEVDRSVPGLSNPDGTVNTQTVEVVFPLESNKITYNDTYYWWVKVYDSKGGDSGWVAGPSFTTLSAAKPYPDFTWTPESPSIEEVVEFTDQTTFYGTSGTESWIWDFGDGATCSGPPPVGQCGEALDYQNPTHSYSTAGPYFVTLTAQDDNGTCSTDPIELITTLPLPEWKEITPFGLFDNFLAMISESFNPLFRGI